MKNYKFISFFVFACLLYGCASTSNLDDNEYNANNGLTSEADGDSYSDARRYDDLYNDGRTYDPYKTPNEYVVNGTLEDFAITAGDRVLFPLNVYKLSNADDEVLRRQANWIIDHKDIVKELIIEGHCDERGTREYNIALGEKRANSVKEMLISFGVDRNIIHVVSYGKDKPTVEGNHEEAWRFNRRVVSVPIIDNDDAMTRDNEKN